MGKYAKRRSNDFAHFYVRLKVDVMKESKWDDGKLIKVLVVESDKDLRNILKELFELAPFDSIQQQRIPKYFYFGK